MKPRLEVTSDGIGGKTDVLGGVKARSFKGKPLTKSQTVIADSQVDQDIFEFEESPKIGEDANYEELARSRVHSSAGKASRTDERQIALESNVSSAQSDSKLRSRSNSHQHFQKEELNELEEYFRKLAREGSE